MRWRLVIHNLIETASQKPANAGKHREIDARDVPSEVMQKLCALHICPGDKLVLADSVRDAILLEPQRNPAIIGIRHANHHDKNIMQVLILTRVYIDRYNYKQVYLFIPF